MRRRRRKGVFEKLEKYAQMFMTQEQFEVKDICERFQMKEWVLELGCGRGKFLTAYASRHPECFCIGVELKEEVIIKACERAENLSLTNILFVLGDSERFIDVFEQRPVDALFIHFCDPWPKDRHAKRRLVHSRFLKRYAKIMKPYAELRFKTDNGALFAYAQEAFKESPFDILSITDQVSGHPHWVDNIMTEYETKFSALGMDIHGLIGKRK